MSERLDAVLNGAKDTVVGVGGDGHPTRRRGGGDGGAAGRRVQPFPPAFERLDRHGKAGGSATEAADAAVKSRAPARAGLPGGGVGVAEARRPAGGRGPLELYRRFSRVSETLIEAGPRLYATVKEVQAATPSAAPTGARVRCPAQSRGPEVFHGPLAGPLGGGDAVVLVGDGLGRGVQLVEGRRCSRWCPARGSSRRGWGGTRSRRPATPAGAARALRPREPLLGEALSSGTHRVARMLVRNTSRPLA